MEPRTPPPLRRTAVIGTSGAGKTTFARRLAGCLGVEHVELDAIFWGPGWTPTPRDDFRERTADALRGDSWTVDGNYSAVRDLVWSRADTVVWLDFSLPVVMWRVVSRTFWRILTREELWSGNKERLSNALFSRESIILWSLQTYARRRRDYPVLFSQPENAHLHLVRLRSPRQARRWLQDLAPRRQAGREP